jgi:hypothetical protein
MPVHCTHISTKSIEVEAPEGLHGSKIVKLELSAMHEGKIAKIKILCAPMADILNERNKHFIRMNFHSITEKDIGFIKTFADAHS